MKISFIESRYEEKFILPDEHIEKLPKSICLATTIQYYDSLEAIKQQLEEKGINVTLFKGKHSSNPGQLLGCDILESDESKQGSNRDFEAFLYIGDGMFHPKALMLKSDKEVFTYNPLTESFNKITQEDIQKLKQRQKAALAKFYSASNIGIIVTTKPGQEHLKKAIVLKNKLEQKQKNCFIFITDTINLNELENFPFIESWVNTACPRIAYDDAVSMVTLDDSLASF
ncbi:2-(3-amino-3-carboxypropyl)histidine synthase subunit [Candidatus Woesearchaeota archaeon]|nr:2-(3-amino-3-carboxypropyl)histidine synthase subunit [Candidatus Woesearchaeota archaeon]